MKWFLGAILLISIGCSNPDEGYIEEDKFVEILTDIHLADAVVSYELGKDMDALRSVQGYYTEVFEKHGVTKEEFEKSYDHYSEDLNRMKTIFEKVQKRLRKLEKEGFN